MHALNALVACIAALRSSLCQLAGSQLDRYKFDSIPSRCSSTRYFRIGGHSPTTLTSPAVMLSAAKHLRLPFVISEGGDSPGNRGCPDL
jgi:hypothetical protein